jgi:hypothetical protein
MPPKKKKEEDYWAQATDLQAAYKDLAEIFIRQEIPDHVFPDDEDEQEKWMELHVQAKSGLLTSPEQALFIDFEKFEDESLAEQAEALAVALGIQRGASNAKTLQCLAGGVKFAKPAVDAFLRVVARPAAAAAGAEPATGKPNLKKVLREKVEGLLKISKSPDGGVRLSVDNTFMAEITENFAFYKDKVCSGADKDPEGSLTRSLEMKGVVGLLRDAAMLKGKTRTEGTIPPGRIIDYLLEIAQPQLDRLIVYGLVNMEVKDHWQASSQTGDSSVDVAGVLALLRLAVQDLRTTGDQGKAGDAFTALKAAFKQKTPTASTPNGEKTCYQCHQVGHVKAECPHRPAMQQGFRGGGKGGRGRGGSRGGYAGRGKGSN